MSDDSNLFVSSPGASPDAEDITDGTRRMHIDDRSSSPVRGMRANDRSSSPIRYSSSIIHPSSSELGGDYSSSQLRASQRRGDLFSSDLGGIGTRRRRRPDPLSAREVLSSEGDESVQLIWGTTVNIRETHDLCLEFLRTFKPKYRTLLDGGVIIPGEGEDYHYMDMLADMYKLGSTNLNLDARNLLSFGSTSKLYYQLISYPQEVVPIMDGAVKECMIGLLKSGEAPGIEVNAQDLEQVATTVYKVRPFNVGEVKNLRELNPTDIDKLISIKGLVIRSSPVVPDMKEAFFKCSVCDHTTVIESERGLIVEPEICPREQCKSKNSMQIIHNRSIFADKQVVRIQETPDETPPGQTPHSVSICTYDELVDVCRPGDRILVTGVYRSTATRINPRQRTVRSLFKTYLDVVHIQKIDNKRMDADQSTLENLTNTNGDGNSNVANNSQSTRDMDVDMDNESATNGNLEASVARSEFDEVRALTPDDIERIKEVAARPDVYELLAHSVAPSVFENVDVKKGILLQLFGGTNKKFERSGSPRFRGDINILLCGDPSTSKSQMLGHVHRIAPRGCYTSGKGSSAVGLTAYITRDPDTKQMVLESGALVLSDGGVCCIDEFDKMSDSTRSVLHEVMEQQTISVAKAGIITTLNARTSILASANPIGSKYDPNLSVTKNIDLPPSLLSRFDLVYLMIDKIDERHDRKLASHITSLYMDPDANANNDVDDAEMMDSDDEPSDNAATAVYDPKKPLDTAKVLPIEFLTLYISYAKQHCKPILTPAAKNELVKAYVEMRLVGKDPRGFENRVTATTRQLESMIRLSEAHAKMRLAQEVTLDDALEAVRLIRSAIKEYAMDPVTGTIDMDLIQTGTSAIQRRLRSSLAEHLLSILENASSSSMPYSELLREARAATGREIENLEVGDALRTLVSEDKIAITGEGNTRLIRRLAVAA